MHKRPGLMIFRNKIDKIDNNIGYKISLAQFHELYLVSTHFLIFENFYL
jgi:hypothetical protein